MKVMKTYSCGRLKTGCYYINCSAIASGSKSIKMVITRVDKNDIHSCDIIFEQSARNVCHV